MSQKPRVLVVDDELPIRNLLVRWFASRGFEPVACEGGRSALAAVQSESVDLALVDVRMQDMNGLDVLRELRQLAPECEVVLMSGFAAVETAVEAIKLGATDYLGKPLDFGRLSAIVSAARDRAERRRQVMDAERDVASRLSFHGMIARSSLMEELFSLIGRIAPYARISLVTGETGTGKELVAHAIHALGPRAKNKLLSVNCSAIVPTLAESELFGHVRGAFTGAVGHRTGLFELADGGTLFLDEIGELPFEMQTKLLRVLETGDVVRVGAEHQRRVDVHVIAATNRDLRVEVEQGRFRADLLYRLNAIELHVPPLRDRREDIPYLVAAFTREFADRFGKAILGITSEFERRLMTTPWEGNIRELRNVIERACMLAGGAWLEDRDWPRVGTPASPAMPADSEAGLGSDKSLQAVEREHLLKVLERANGNKQRAAALLGVSRRSLYRLLEAHGLQQLVARRPPLVS